jgi:hypothetical protein
VVARQVMQCRVQPFSLTRMTVTQHRPSLRRNPARLVGLSRRGQGKQRGDEQPVDRRQILVE